MSLRAYQQANARSERPRESEYRLFGQVTRALIEASKPENQLPTPLRAQIISLNSWVRRHSSAVMKGEAQFDDLIEINRIMMQGLEPKVALTN